MVHLQHQRCLRNFGQWCRCIARWRVDFNILVNGLAVEENLDESCIFRFLTLFIKARRLEDYLQCLPLAGG